MAEDGATREPLRHLSRSVGAAVFGTDVAGYATARSGYPAELYEALRARCGPNVSAILEIGPGTGLATTDLLATFAPQRLVATESDPALARHLDATIADVALEVVNSGFEEAVIDGPFDLACCAAAFHWLDSKLAFPKLRRVLRPGATLALWWNVYRQVGIGDAFADAVTPLIAHLPLPPSDSETGHYSLDVAHHCTAITGAGFVDFAPHLFRRERTMTRDQVRALYASYSYVRALPDAERSALLDAIGTLADDAFGGTVPNVTLTALYVASVPLDL